MKGKLKKRAGITLIALVISIIVLLILAGVSIATLTGENGILTRAAEAEEKSEQATEEEQRKLAQINATMHNELWYYKEGQGELTQEKGKETEGAIPIPAGFAPTQIEGENSVEDGFVITDSKGNEFVWIPCKYSADDSGNEVVYNKEGADGDKDSRDDTWKTRGSYYNAGTWHDYQPHHEGMTSVKTYGGFYVARYEAGVPSDAPFYASKDGDAYYNDTGRVKKLESEQAGTSETGKNIQGTKYTPVSQKGQQVWNYIDQKNAKAQAEKMVENNTVKSYLIDSHAWNTICRIMKKKGKLKEEDLNDSTKWGNYCNNTTTKYENIKTLWAQHTSNGFIPDETYKYGLIPKEVVPNGSADKGLELATGSSDDFKVYNIYDMAGNVWEWTTEAGNNNGKSSGSLICDEELCESAIHAVMRGGCFVNIGKTNPIIHLNGYDEVGLTLYSVGFRVVLYFK